MKTNKDYSIGYIENSTDVEVQTDTSHLYVESECYETSVDIPEQFNIFYGPTRVEFIVFLSIGIAVAIAIRVFVSTFQ